MGRPHSRAHTGVPALNKLLDHCAAEGLSNVEVAVEIGLHRNSLSIWRTGKSCPSIANAEAVANHMGYTFKLVKIDAEED